MTRTHWIWVTLIILYGTFFSWYTSFGGPLSDEEISAYMEKFEARGGTQERLAVLRKFMEEDTGDDFVMINVIHMYETPLQVEGVDPGQSSDDVLNQSMEYMWPALISRASHPVIFGDAASPALDIMNADGMHQWTRGAGMRYRSRRDMLEISSNPAFSGSHEFKIAAMRKTIAFPLDPWIQLGDPRLVLGLLFALIGCALSWLHAARR